MPSPPSVITPDSGDSVGELTVVKHELHVEMQLVSSKMTKPRLYAYALTDKLEAFYAPHNARLAQVLGDPRFLWRG